MTRPLTVLPFGGCLLFSPLDPFVAKGESVRYPRYGRPYPTYTFGEMIQSIDVLRGARHVPLKYRPLCRMKWHARAKWRGVDFRDVDVALIEPGSPVELTFRGFNINRAAVVKRVIRVVEPIGPEAKKQVNRWFRVGLVGFDEAVRADAAERVLALLPPVIKDAELVRASLQDIRSSRSDIVGGFRRMQQLLDRPIGVAVYIFQYMPDGRAVSWPAGFHEEVIAAARELELPVFDPSPLVRQHGVQAVLARDLRHYKPSFMPVMADALMEFARGVAERARTDSDRIESEPPLMSRLVTGPLRRMFPRFA